MAQTQVRGSQILNATIQRQDVDTSTVGQALVAKLLQGTNITLSSTGADSGTGDVTISTAAATKWFNGTGAPGTIPGSQPGDYYLDTASGDVWTL